MEVRHAREVVVFDEYTMVPLAPPQLLGVVNLRGSVMPLVDIRPFFGLELPRVIREVRALVVECDGVQAAMLIDEVLGLEPMEGLVPAGEGDEARRPGHVSAGRIEREEGAATLLDVQGILEALGGGAQSDGEEH